MSYARPNFQVTIPNGQYLSTIASLPPDAYLANLFVPNTITGTTLTFFGDVGDGVMRQLNISWNLTAGSTQAGNIITDLQGEFTGLVRLQVSTGSGMTQSGDISIVGGYVY